MRSWQLVLFADQLLGRHAHLGTIGGLLRDLFQAAPRSEANRLRWHPYIMKKMGGRELPTARRNDLLGILKDRFEKNTARHPGLRWSAVQARLEASVEKLWSLSEMEITGGEPDVVGHETEAGEYVLFDCSAQSPKNRRSLCYDHEALESRKEHRPKDSAVGMATAMGIKLLTEEQYRQLQQLGEFDTTTSSWIMTPPDVRQLGGALFCDRRFNKVFVYHNGAESYYAARGFRGALKV